MRPHVPTPNACTWRRWRANDNERAEMRRGAMSPAGWSGAGYRDQPTGRKRRFDYVIGLTSSDLSGPRRTLRRTSKFPRKLAKRNWGGEVYALIVCPSSKQFMCHVRPRRRACPALRPVRAFLPISGARRSSQKSTSPAVFWAFNRPWAIVRWIMLTGCQDKVKRETASRLSMSQSG